MYKSAKYFCPSSIKIYLRSYFYIYSCDSSILFNVPYLIFFTFLCTGTVFLPINVLRLLRLCLRC